MELFMERCWWRMSGNPRFGVGALRCVRTRKADVLRAKTGMSPAQMWSMFSAVLGRQKPPNRGALVGLWRGKCVRPYRQNIHWIKLTAKTKFTGRGRRPTAPGTRWLCARAAQLLRWHTLQPRAVSRHQHLKRADATSLWREKQVKTGK